MLQATCCQLLPWCKAALTVIDYGNMCSTRSRELGVYIPILSSNLQLKKGSLPGSHEIKVQIVQSSNS
jgi:hypothetical protein